MKNLFLHLYIHQPANTDEKYFREVTDTLYIPVFRTIKTSKNLTLSLSITLSVLEQLDKYNYKNLLQEIKELIHQEKITLVSCPAYNNRLELSNENFLLNQIILNEYALGYYFGMRNGFEGESAILIKDISTCFYPGNHITLEFLKEVNEIGYPSILLGSGFYTLSEDLIKENKISGLETNELHIMNLYDRFFNVNADINKSVGEFSKSSLLSLPVDSLYSIDHDFSYRFAKFIDKIIDSKVDISNTNLLIDDDSLDYLTNQPLETLLEKKDDKNDVNSVIKLQDMANIRELILSLVALSKTIADSGGLDVESSNLENAALWLDKYAQTNIDIKLNFLANRYSDIKIWEKDKKDLNINLQPLKSTIQELDNVELLSKIEKIID